MTKKYKNWKLETDDNGILWCHLDKHGASTNVLSMDVLAEFGEIINNIENAPPHGLIICSDKDNGFIAGADVKEFTEIKTREQALEIIRNVHGIFDRLESLSCPALCLINGFCLGGGLELALACRYRVALDDPRTRLGLPEVLLGIHPGFGGTMRLIRLVGVMQAMQMMLAGKNIDARRAKRIGLVDRTVPLRQIKNAAVSLILNQPAGHRPGSLKRLVNQSLFRPILSWFFRRELKKRVNKEHYPAPYTLVDLWEQYGGSEKKMLDMEAESVSDLILSDTSRNLVRVFLLQERLKTTTKVEDFEPEKVHVVGAGVMGGDIAAWCALKGFKVTLQDRSPEFIAPAINRAHELFKKRLKERRRITAAMDRLIPDLNGHGIAGADVIIEAIVENLEAKAELFRELEGKARQDAVLATNTSSIPLDEISRHLTSPERLTGIHFFNPVARMQLVEIVHSGKTARVWTTKALGFCGRIDRLPLQVRSSPGFLVNRILTPYLLEAVAMIEEGVPAEVIDDTAVRFGMPMGPVELADRVGLDICMHVADNMVAKIDMELPDKLRQMVNEGRVGRKAGRGFYQYKRGKPVKRGADTLSVDSEDLEDRLILRILNECVACMHEGIVTYPDLLDAGMVYGTGFAPFRGGPLHYAKSQGTGEILDRLIALEIRYGDRFKPDPGWKDMTSGNA